MMNLDRSAFYETDLDLNERFTSRVPGIVMPTRSMWPRFGM